jgi:hypothetical protein
LGGKFPKDLLTIYILSLREGLVTALILGIVSCALQQIQRLNKSASVWLGARSATLISPVTAILLTQLGLEMKDLVEAIFEIQDPNFVKCVLASKRVFCLLRQDMGLA